jgi:hypothetical protein
MTEIVQSRYLEKKNKLPFDDKITFEAEDHVYNVRSEYFPMVLSKYNGGTSLPVDSVTTFISKYFPSGFDQMAINLWNNIDNRIKMENDTTYKYFGCKSVDDIKKIWSVGAEAGTKMHGHFEDLGNLFTYNYDHPNDNAFMNYVESQMTKYNEFRYFKRFCHEFGINGTKREFFRTEFCMFHEELHISGMIDGLIYNKEKDGYEIIDYKRCKDGVKMPPKNPRKQVQDLSSGSRGQILPSLMMLRNLPIVKYGLQLSIYRYMFERIYPEKKIIGLYLISVNSTYIDLDVLNNKYDAFEIIEIPLHQYDQAVFEIFQQRAKDIIDECGDALPSKLFDKLCEFLPPPVEIYEDEDDNDHVYKKKSKHE